MPPESVHDTDCNAHEWSRSMWSLARDTQSNGDGKEVYNGLHSFLSSSFSDTLPVGGNSRASGYGSNAANPEEALSKKLLCEAGAFGNAVSDGITSNTDIIGRSMRNGNAERSLEMSDCDISHEISSLQNSVSSYTNAVESHGADALQDTLNGGDLLDGRQTDTSSPGVTLSSLHHSSTPAMDGHSCSHEINSPEPLAIIGMAFRFPSGAETESTFWDMLLSKHCASSEFPADRLNIDAFYNADPEKPHSIHTRHAHFLSEDIRLFDAHHFGIPPSEAGAMDPDQRGLMETTYHALENAGITNSAISGTNTSVHVGFFSSDHMTFNLRDPLRIPKYYATGSSNSILSNRISWYFNLRGPSMTIDTACSSGLIALDLACQGLWAGTSDMAIVGAANLILSPELNIALCNMNFLSCDGRCYSFDHRASGYARGEGFSALVLKPLSKALAAGDTIRALVRSVGSNQDGHTSGGITQPSKEMQASLIRDTYARAGLDMRTTRFFEAHGTGTVVGDPTEARAIGESFRQYRTDDEPLYVGAVKSNIGHLEGASGLAGVVKAVLALEKAVIPPNTNFEKLNPNIDDEFHRLHFPQHHVPWPETNIRRASVNSFGFGGSNAHVVLDDAFSYLRSKNLNGNHFSAPTHPSTFTSNHVNGKLKGEVDAPLVTEEPWKDEVPGFSPTLFILSSSDEVGISHQINSHGLHIQRMQSSTLPDTLPSYAYTLASRRTLLPFRCFGVVDSRGAINSFSSIMSSPIQSHGKNPTLGFVFTGQGAQWHGMGRELLSEPVFLESIQRSQSCLEELGCSWKITELLTSKTHAPHIGEAEFSQTVTTSVQVAMVDLIAWLALTPSVIVGHSSGEIAAAYAAGHISQASAIKISYYRGLLASKLERSSAIGYSMAAVGLSQEDATSELRVLETDQESGIAPDTLTISCINSPSNVTISGPVSLISILIDHLSRKEVFARQLKVGLGYHSSQMTLISTEYLFLLADLEPGHGDITSRPIMVSSVTGDVVDTSVVCTGEYWVRNMVSPVNFLGAMQFCYSSGTSDPNNKRLDSTRILDLHADGWLEIGPHAALRGPIREILKMISTDKEIIYTSVLLRHKSALFSTLAAAGELFCRSFTVDMSHVVVLGLSPAQRSTLKVLPNLPKYQFSRSTLHWEEPQLNKNFRFRRHGNHDLLGTMITDSNSLESQWKFIISEDLLPWVRDHKVDGLILYPAAGMIVMAIEAAKQVVEDDMPLAFELENVEFPAPIVLNVGFEGVEVRIHMSSNVKGTRGETDYKFRIFICKADGHHEVVCSGTIRGDYGRATSDVDGKKQEMTKTLRIKSDLETMLATCTGTWGFEEMYQTILDSTGLDYGPEFQVLTDVLFHKSGKAVAAVLPRNPDSTSPYTVHPTRLDGIFQLGFAALNAMNRAKAMVPTFLSRIWVPVQGFGHQDGTSEKAFAWVQSATERIATLNIKAVDAADAVLRTEVTGLEVTAVALNVEAATSLASVPYLCSRIEWKADFEILDAEEVRTYCESARPTKAEPVEYFRNMDALVIQYAARALRKVDQQGGYVAPHMEKYARWLRLQVGLLDSASLVSDGELEHMCASAIHTARGEMQVRVGQQLSEFLRGEADPLQIIFADEAKVTDFYRELMEDTTGVVPFRQYLDTLVHKSPSLRFLEVGAGTGSSTAVILRTIGDANVGPRFKEYTYTDISPSFFEQANLKFAEHSQMKYQVLNVEKDLAVQGFEFGAYDVVIADNVLHATQDLRVTLSNIRKLLRPGGKLVLKELTTPGRLLTGFSFGLLPGWWLAKETERELSPLITEGRWDEMLKDTGFSGVDLMFPDHSSPEAHIWSIMISTAIVEDSIHLPPKAGTHGAPLFVIDRASSLQTKVAFELCHVLDFPCGSNLLSLADASALCEAEPSLHDFIFLHELEGSILCEVEETNFRHLQKLLGSARSIIWVKQGASAHSSPELGMSDGLCRVSRHEHHNTVVSLCLESVGISSIANIARVYRITQKWTEDESLGSEHEYEEIEGMLCVNRLTRAKNLDEHIFKRTMRPVLHQQTAERKLKVGIRALGLLDTIQFSEVATFNDSPGPSEVDVEVRAIGINYRDCLTLLGKFDSDHIGSECSGIVRTIGKDVEHVSVGDRVLVAAHDVFRTYVRVPGRTVIRIPDTVRFTEAASISTAFCTAYYSIFTLAHLQKGDTILIHAAAGGTGQAMVQLALLAGAEIYATVGSDSKKKLLMEEYRIPEDHIFYSRDSSFADGIMEATGNRGADVIINTQQGQLLEASWNCIATSGRFIDIGLKDAYLRNQLPMQVFTRNVSFSGVNISTVMLYEEKRTRQVLENVLGLFVDGKIQTPKPIHTYSLENIEQAVRFLQSGKSSGKVVLEVDKKANVPIVQGPESEYLLPEDATYLIAGGLGGVGRSIARWLVHRGARHLILLSRSGRNEQAQKMLADLRMAGVNIQCPTCDVADLASLKRALQECQRSMPKIRGCIQAAMVLRDTMFSEMTLEEWKQATRPKVQGTWNLHEVLPSGMDFFVLLSSCAGIVGHTGQSNYCAGNTYEDAFARYRSSIGEKAVSIDVGVVLEEGFVAENEQVMDRLMRLKLFRPNTLAEIFAILDYYCNPQLENITATDSQVVTGFELPADIVARGGDCPSALEQPLFRCLHQAEGWYKHPQSSISKTLSFKAAFISAESPTAGGLVVSESLKMKVSRVLGLPAEQIGLDSTLDSYGIDSLVGLELRNWLAKESGADVAVFEILGGVTVRDIGRTVASKSSMRPESWGDV